MFVPNLVNPKRTLPRLLLSGVLIISGCQMVPLPIPQQAPPSGRLLSDQTTQSQPGADASQGNASTAASTPVATDTIKRETVNKTLALSGRVAPARSAQLTFRGTGTVTTVNVTPGQTVSAGTNLAELALDDSSLEAARTQATMAQLSYQNEQAKLDSLKAGASKDTVEQQQAVVERDKADIQKIQQDQSAAQQAVDNSENAKAAAKVAADRKAALAEIALQSAKDALADAEANAQRLQADVQATQQAAKAEADNQAAAAASAVRATERQVKEAEIKLSQAKMGSNQRGAGQALESLTFKIDLDKQALQEAKDQGKSATTPDQQTAAKGAINAANRALAADELELKHVQANFDNAKTLDSNDIQLAQMAYDAVKEQLTQAQLAEQRAQQKVQQLANQSSTSAAAKSGESDPKAAQSAVNQAKHAVETQTINLEEAQAAQQAAADATTAAASAPPAQSVAAAQAQLTADQTKLDNLKAGSSQAALDAQAAQVDILRRQAQVAAAAAQPIVSLTAPFDGTVTDVGVTVGQLVGMGGVTTTGSTGSTTGASQSVAQTTDTLPQAIRLVAEGTNTVVANVQEADVSQLDVGQPVSISFPGSPGQSIDGQIGDVGGTPVRNDKDNSVSFPVRVDVPSLPTGVRVGMTADLSIDRPQARDVLVAPREALRSQNGQTIITRVDADGQAQDVPVNVGQTRGSGVVILSGVNEGDVVAIYNTGGVTAGVRQP